MIESKDVYFNVRARYNIHDAKTFAALGFAPIIIGGAGMVNSSINYFGLSFDIGSFFGLGSFILTESMLMIPVFFLFGMLFFVGGIEWWVLCRHCPCYEYSGKEHGNDGRFYCLANWGSPKLFKYKPGKISRSGQFVFLIWGILYMALPLAYLWDRPEWIIVQLVIIGSFYTVLRHWCCSCCPNFGCILNCVSDENKEKFIEAVQAGHVYSN